MATTPSRLNSSRIPCTEAETPTSVQWNRLRDQTAAEAAWLIAGSDESKSGQVAKRIAALLDQHHTGSTAKNAKVANSGPGETGKSMDCAVWSRSQYCGTRRREMAELLSNPCLPLALKHMQEQEKKVAEGNAQEPRTK